MPINVEGSLLLRQLRKSLARAPSLQASSAKPLEMSAEEIV